MTSLDERIAQFRKMAQDDPDNELGHFRLGQLLTEAGQHEEAIRSFRRTLELSPQFSKVYQLLGASLMKLGRTEDAATLLREGFQVADERGDKIPRDEMAKLLVELGQPAPEPKRETESAAGADGFHCQRPGCVAGAYARRLDKPPLPDDMGRQIQERICADCWEYWFRNLSIKVINEMRLDLSTEKGQEVYDQIMKETLGLQ